MAEEGIAAHWKYKEGRVGDQRDERYFQWMRQLLEYQQEVRDPQEFIQNLEGRALSRGGLRLHAEGPGQGVSARRDADRLRLLDPHRRRPSVRRRARQRQDGAAPHAPEERRHRRNHHAGRAQAEPRLAELRRHVARALQDQAPHPRARRRRAPIELGRKVFEKEARRYDLNRQDAASRARRSPRLLAGLRRAEGRTSSSRAIGYGKLAAEAGPRRSSCRPIGCARSRRKGRSPAAVKRVLGTGEEKIKVRGFDDLMVFRARCCNPIRGEKIVGYITRGKGVSVHSATCPNVVNLLYDPERRIDVEWDKGDRRASRATPSS